MAERPLVSVVIPYYNNDNEKFLRQCFDSVVHQTYSPIELIVIDDGSEIGASQLLETLRKEYHFILEKQSNKGVSGALNAGVRHARGKYIAFMGADDYWALNKIELQVEFMESSPTEIGAVCSRGYYIFENDPERPHPRLTRVLHERELSFDSLLRVNCIMAMTVMIRMGIFTEIGMFDEKSAIEDWDMWLRIADKYRFGYLTEPLAYYRRHGNNRSSRFDRKWYESVKYMLSKWEGRTGQKQSLNQLEISGINNFARNEKSEALKIAAANLQCANQWLYWRGILKVFAPGLIYRRK